MTRDEVIEKLTDAGFTVKSTDITDEDIVIHRGGQVACIYDTYVCIANYYPSLNPDGKSASYADADKAVIMFSHPIEEVDTAIHWLLDSPDKIDREKRQKRIESIRRYFDERRSASLDERRSR